MNFCFYLGSRKMKEENLEALCANMDILILDWMFVRFLSEKAISLVPQYGMEYWIN